MSDGLARVVIVCVIVYLTAMALYYADKARVAEAKYQSLVKLVYSPWQVPSTFDRSTPPVNVTEIIGTICTVGVDCPPSIEE